MMYIEGNCSITFCKQLLLLHFGAIRSQCSLHFALAIGEEEEEEGNYRVFPKGGEAPLLEKRRAPSYAVV